MSSGRQEFTDEDEDLLVKYIAKYNPQKQGRCGNELYKKLVANEKRTWSFSRRHTWSSWRDYYVRQQARLDALVLRHQKRQGTVPEPKDKGKAPATPKASQRIRAPFTSEDDDHLVEYLAIANPSGRDRLGNTLYKRLVDNEDDFWPWASRHPASSWRERYKVRQAAFDRSIARCYTSYGIDPHEPSLNSKKAWKKIAQIKAEHAVVKGKASTSTSNDREDEENTARSAPSTSAKDNGKRPMYQKTPDDRERKRRRIQDREYNSLQIEGADSMVDKGSSIQSRSIVDQEIPAIEAIVESEGDETVEEDELIEEDQDAKKTQEEEVDEEDEREPCLQPPPSDFYEGDIFVSPGAPSEANSSPVRVKKHKSVPKALENHENEDDRSPPELEYAEPEYIIVRPSDHSKDPMNVDHHHGYPSTSTPRGEAPPPISQVIPSPETLDKLQMEQLAGLSRNMNISQEPTPPTSDAPNSPDRQANGRINDPFIDDPVIDRQAATSDQDPIDRRESYTLHPPPNPSATHLSLQANITLSQKRERHRRTGTDANDDFFHSPEPVAAAQNSPPLSPRARKLPVRVEGAFNSALDERAFKKGTVRRASGVGEGPETQSTSPAGEEPTEWPPRRRKATARGVGSEREEVVVPTKAPTAADTSEHTAEEFAREHHPFSQPTQLPAESQAVPSKLPLPARETTPHHPFSQPTQSQATYDVFGAADSDPRLGMQKGTMLPPQTIPKRSTMDGAAQEPPRMRGRSTGSRRVSVGDEDDGLESGHQDKGKGRAKDVFPERPADRRHTLAGTFPKPLFLHAREARHSLPSTRTSSPRSRYEADPSLVLSHAGIVISPRDRARVLDHAIEGVLNELSQKYGFTKDVVLEIWRHSDSLTTVENVLYRAIIRVEEEATVALHEYSTGEGASDDYSRIANGSWDRSYNRSTQRSPNRSTVFEITPLIPSNSPPSPAYIPPDESRAALFVKGKKAEARRGWQATARRRSAHADSFDTDEEEAEVVDAIHDDDDGSYSANVVSSRRSLSRGSRASSPRTEVAKRILARARRPRS